MRRDMSGKISILVLIYRKRGNCFYASRPRGGCDIGSCISAVAITRLAHVLQRDILAQGTHFRVPRGGSMVWPRGNALRLPSAAK